MFINILSGLHPLEARFCVCVKDKKLDTKYKITKEVVAEAYSDINGEVGLESYENFV